MAKAKQKTFSQPSVEEVKAPEMETVTQTKKPPSDPKWEIKDRVYYLKGDDKPVACIVKTQDIYWFDEEKGYEREVKLTTNQKTVFVDEMMGQQRLAHIIFRDGMLVVPKNKVQLQKLLSLYHPGLNRLYYEHKPIKKAVDELATIETEMEALNAAINLDISMAEAVMRSIIGSKVSKMSSKELKRDLLIEAKKKPKLIMSLINDDNVHLRNIGVKAVEASIITLASNQRAFHLKSTGQKLLTVPFDEHPYSALAAWFKTDEGMDIYTGIEKRLK